VVAMALWAAFGVLACWLAVAAICARRDRALTWAGLRRAASWLNPRMAWLISLRLLLALSARGIEQSEPLLTLTYAGLAAVVLGGSAYHLSRDAERPVARPLPPRWVPAAALTALFVGYSSVMTVLSWRNLWGFNMGRSDMGYYVSIFRH